MSQQPYQMSPPPYQPIWCAACETFHQGTKRWFEILSGRQTAQGYFVVRPFDLVSRDDIDTATILLRNGHQFVCGQAGVLLLLERYLHQTHVDEVALDHIGKTIDEIPTGK